jgi:hypothetical protein
MGPGGIGPLRPVTDFAIAVTLVAASAVGFILRALLPDKSGLEAELRHGWRRAGVNRGSGARSVSWLARPRNRPDRGATREDQRPIKPKRKAAQSDGFSKLPAEYVRSLRSEHGNLRLALAERRVAEAREPERHHRPSRRLGNTRGYH